MFPCGPAKSLTYFWILEYGQAAVCHRIDVADVIEEAIDTILDHFRDTTDPGGDNRGFTSHGFQSHKPEGFQFARQQKNV